MSAVSIPIHTGSTSEFQGRQVVVHDRRVTVDVTIHHPAAVDRRRVDPAAVIAEP